MFTFASDTGRARALAQGAYSTTVVGKIVLTFAIT